MTSTYIASMMRKWLSPDFFRDLAQTSPSSLWKSLHAVFAASIFHDFSLLRTWSLPAAFIMTPLLVHFVVFIWTTLTPAWTAANLWDIGLSLWGWDNADACFASSVFVYTILTALKLKGQKTANCFEAVSFSPCIGIPTPSGTPTSASGNRLISGDILMSIGVKWNIHLWNGLSLSKLDSLLKWIERRILRNILLRIAHRRGLLGGLND